MWKSHDLVLTTKYFRRLVKTQDEGRRTGKMGKHKDLNDFEKGQIASD